MNPGNWEDTVEVLLGGNKTVNTMDKIGDLVGCYLKTGVSGDTVPFKISGRLGAAPKQSATAVDVWAAGDRLYWDNSAGKFTKVSNGTPPVATAAAAAVQAATVGEVILLGGGLGIGGEPVNITIPLTASSVDVDAFVADRAYQVVAIKEIHSVVGGGAAAVRPRKITDTSAPGAGASGTVKELTQAAFDCTATINTTQSGTLSATLTDLQLAAGNRIALDFSGTLTGLVGVLTITLVPI